MAASGVAMFAEPLVLRLGDAASAWLLTYLVHSTLFLVGVWAVTSRRSLRETTRDVLWKLALVGGLITASVQSVVAREPLGGQLRLDARRTHEAEPVRIAVRQSAEGERARVFVAESKGTRWTAIVVVLWATGAGVALLWFTWSHGRAARVFADRTSLDDAPVASRLRALLARSGIRRDVALTCSANIASPVALASGEVCLPRRALVELDGVEQESMLAHEVAHIVRRDPHWLIGARLIEAVFFVQPLNRLARHRMQSAAEFLCDDWAVQRTSEPVTLAKCLAAVAEWVGRAPRLHAMSAMVESSGSPLVQRVRRILAETHGRRTQSSRAALAASFCVLVVFAAAAPRISVAGEAMGARTMMFVRAIVAPDGASRRGDTLLIVRSGGSRIHLDSTTLGIGVDRMSRRRVGQSNVMIRRLSRGTFRPDSAVAIAREWTRSLGARDSALIGAMPVGVERTGRVIRVERYARTGQLP
jgi:beta-lactamase regulating signal transducer with metallopeptidase domain